MTDCVFCDEDRIRAPRIQRVPGLFGFEHLVFEPLAPVVPGHLLVVPVTHVTNAVSNPMVTAAAAGIAAQVAGRYRSANIITNVGAPATQTVDHLHWHVVPRRFGDGLRLPWSR